jgi:hypothetical protein
MGAWTSISCTMAWIWTWTWPVAAAVWAHRHWGPASIWRSIKTKGKIKRGEHERV